MLYSKELRQYNIDQQSYLLLKNGLKPVIRIVISENEIRPLKNFLKSIGVFFVIKEIYKLYEQKLENPIVNAYISLSQELAEEAYRVEKSGNRSLFGKLLGYPDCCVEKFIKNYIKDEDHSILSYKMTRGKSSFFCNNIFIFDSKISFNNYSKFLRNTALFAKVKDLFLIRHTPCSFDCKKSIILGKRTLKLLEKEKLELAKKIVDAIKRPILYFDYFNWLVFDGEIKNEELIYKKLLPYESLFPKRKIAKIKLGNKIKTSKKEISILKDNKVILRIPKKDKYNGIIINFQ